MGGGGGSGQESRIVRQQRGVFSVGCKFCIGSRAARDYFFLRALLTSVGAEQISPGDGLPVVTGSWTWQ